MLVFLYFASAGHVCKILNSYSHCLTPDCMFNQESWIQRADAPRACQIEHN